MANCNFQRRLCQYTVNPTCLCHNGTWTLFPPCRGGADVPYLACGQAYAYGGSNSESLLRVTSKAGPQGVASAFSLRTHTQEPLINM